MEDAKQRWCTDLWEITHQSKPQYAAGPRGIYFQVKNVQSPVQKIASQEVTFPVADYVLLRHIKSTVFLFPLVCSAHMNGNCCCRSSFALRVEGDHILPNYVRKLPWHGDCSNKNKCVTHGNNSALGLEQITTLCTEDAGTSLSDTQFQMHQAPNSPSSYFCIASLAVVSFHFASLHPSVIKEKRQQDLLHGCSSSAYRTHIPTRIQKITGFLLFFSLFWN